MPTISCGVRCVPVHSSTPTTRELRVDGGPAFLMAFETDEATVYQVRARHRNEEVREVVPSDYGG